MIGKENRKLFPKFYHIGCLKTGTTSIQEVLKSDKRINLIRSRYFNNNFWYINNYDYYEENKINIESDENIIINYDKFSGFLTSIKRIKRVRPDAVIIITIREQRDLLVSAYKHHIITHDFGGNLEDFLNCSAGKRYLSMCQYSNIYEVLKCYFAAKNIHFLLFEDMKKNYLSFYEDLYKIFDLTLPGEIENVRKNVSYSDSYYLFASKLHKLKLFNKDRYLSKIEDKMHYLIKYIYNLYLSVSYNKTKIKWGKSSFFTAIENDFKICNQEFEKETDLKLSDYDYLL